jgi:hypothetical protein
MCKPDDLLHLHTRKTYDGNLRKSVRVHLLLVEGYRVKIVSQWEGFGDEVNGRMGLRVRLAQFVNVNSPSGLSHRA